MCSGWNSPGKNTRLGYYFLLHLFWQQLSNIQRGILDPRSGIELMPPAVEMRSLNLWTTREVRRQEVLIPVKKFLFLIILLIYLCLWWVLLCTGFSLVAVGRGCSLVAVLGLLPASAPLLWSTGSGTHRLGSCGAWVQLLPACGVFPGQGLNPCVLVGGLLTSEALSPSLIPFYRHGN